MNVLHRQLLRQVRLLGGYLRGEAPSLDKIRLGLFLSERERDPKRPDHYLKQAGRLRIDSYTSIEELLLGTFERLSEHYLERAGYQHVCVRAKYFEQWQDLITDFSSLLLVAYRLQMEMPLADEIQSDRGLTHEDVIAYVDRVYRPQIRYSALPTVHDPRLNHLIRTHGLDEMHIHLTGSTEVELVWIDALRQQEAFANKFMKGQNQAAVEELLRQEDQTLDHGSLLTRLRVARALREWLAHEVLFPLADPNGAKMARIRKTACVLGIIRAAAEGGETECQGGQPGWCSHDGSLHEVVRMWPRLGKDLEPLTQEAFLMAALFHALKTEQSEALAHAAYAYLLIMAQFSRLLVQQREQWGFDQFQKITLNEMREMTEEDYRHRFYQLNYTREGDLDTVEGRFTPKGSTQDNEVLIARILHGYLSFLAPEDATCFRALRPVLDALTDIEAGRKAPASSPARKPSLQLVAHFIKQEDKTNSRGERSCRHLDLRKDLERREAELAATFDRHPRLRRYITGFDGASNELHAPPEVFAPVFRRLRRRGFPHFTFHAGEDFIHLLSGVRAVYEALTLLGLGVGNRVGHATAVGIEPALWRERMGRQIVINKGQRLDDLVLARHLLLRHPGADLRCLPTLELEISRLSQDVYGEDWSPIILFEAWRLRSLDPLYAFELRDVGGVPSRDDRDELDEVDKARKRQSAFELFAKYHGRGHGADGSRVVERYNEPFEISFEEEPLDNHTLRLIQEVVLCEFRDRQVAIETLLTSNVRISVYEKYAEHHVFRWLGLKGDAPVRVCVGSDDPGIFATNLRNEYAHLLRELDALTDPQSAQDYLEQLITTGKAWRFAPPTLDKRALRGSVEAESGPAETVEPAGR